MIGFFLVLAACALWALDTLIRYPLMQALENSLVIVFYEHILLSLVLFVISFKSLKKFKQIQKKHFLYFFIVGGVGSAWATLAFTKAFMYLNPSLVIILQKLQPIIAIVLARIVLKEKIQKIFILWATVCLIGALMISFEDILNIINSKQSFNELFFHQKALLGYVLVLFSAIGWGASTVFSKKLVSLGYTDEIVLGGRFFMGLLCLLPFAIGEQTLFTHSVDTYSKVALMVLVSGLMAMYLYYQGLRRIPARLCTLAEMFFPFMAVIVNWLFLGATLTPIQILGGLILMLGSVVIQVKHY